MKVRIEHSEGKPPDEYHFQVCVILGMNKDGAIVRHNYGIDADTIIVLGPIAKKCLQEKLKELQWKHPPQCFAGNTRPS